jgi:putative oxidoreductase
MDSMHLTLLVVSHFFIGFYFAFFGLWNIYHWKPMIEVMLKKNIPSPLFLLSIAIGWQIICGVMIMFGILVKLSALLLIPFIFIIVFLLHPFWEFTGELRKQHMALFITNFSMSLGALILLLSN